VGRLYSQRSLLEFPALKRGGLWRVLGKSRDRQAEARRWQGLLVHLPAPSSRRLSWSALLPAPA